MKWRCRVACDERQCVGRQPATNRLERNLHTSNLSFGAGVLITQDDDAAAGDGPSMQYVPLLLRQRQRGAEDAVRALASGGIMRLERGQVVAETGKRCAQLSCRAGAACWLLS